MKRLLLILVIVGVSTAVCWSDGIFSPLIYGGLNWGSIVKLPGKIDGVTTATKVGGQTGLHGELKVFGHYLQLGADYIFYNQDIVYNDPANNINGARLFSFHSITVPVTYNFHLFTNTNGNPFFVIGLGFFNSFFVSQHVVDAGTLSGYTLRNQLGGAYLRLTVYPFEFNSRNLGGFYLNFFRSASTNFYLDNYYKGERGSDMGTLNIGFVMKYDL